MIEIRAARLEDAERILEIYAYYVENTAITFECEVPAIDAFRERMRSIMSRYPYLAAEDGGRVMGYAYAGPLNERSAYNWSCEMSIYVNPDARRCGMGRKLYEAMEEALKKMGIRNLYACIGYPAVEDEYLTKNSAAFHAHLGYRMIGKFRQCGFKFGRWYDMVWMEKVIGDHPARPEPVTGYPGIMKMERGQ